MQRQQILGGLVLLAATAAVICGAQLWQAERADTSAYPVYEELLVSTPAAELEGEPVSPNGRFAVRTVGTSDTYVSGVVAPEALQIVDRETGEVLWEDMGYVFQSALWSPDSHYLALAYGARAWQAVRVIETDTWTAWDFTLPDGSPIPEYTFLPDDGSWGQWLDGYTLLLTVGRGGDGGEQHTYRCSVLMDEGRLTGSVSERTAELLPGAYDFDHDGEPETLELATLWEPNGEIEAWYELRVVGRNGIALWSTEPALWHGGYTSVYACRLDGADYLLQYEPEMWQGWADYAYRLFSLDENGEVLVQENTVSFDCNFRQNGHSFDKEAIADFLWDLRGCLADSRLLISTEDGTLYTDGEISPAEVPAYLSDLLTLDSRAAMVDALRQDEAAFKWEQGIE